MHSGFFELTSDSVYLSLRRRLKCIHGDYLMKLRTALENSIFCTPNYISYVILTVQELLALAN